MRTAATRFRTLLDVLPRFAVSSRQSLEALSREYQVPQAELAADLAALAERSDESSEYEYGASVMIDGDSVEVFADQFSRPMRLTSPELCALELGLGVLAHECPPKIAPRLAALLTKLRGVIVDLPQEQGGHGLRGGALTDPAGGDVLGTLRKALRDERKVELLYHSAREAAASARVVRPYALIFSSGSWYLAGWCERNGGTRIFRADRIAGVTVMDEVFEVPADFTLDEFLVNGKPWSASQPVAQLVVRYSPSIARWIAERDGGALETDGSAIRSLPLADREWGVRHVLEYAPDATILEPADLREAVIERLRGMAVTPPVHPS